MRRAATATPIATTPTALNTGPVPSTDAMPPSTGPSSAPAMATPSTVPMSCPLRPAGATAMSHASAAVHANALPMPWRKRAVSSTTIESA